MDNIKHTEPYKMDELDFLIKKSLSVQAEPDYYLLVKTKQAALKQNAKDSKTVFILCCVLSVVSIIFSALAANILLSPVICLFINIYCIFLFCSVLAVSTIKGNAFDRNTDIIIKGGGL